jgi:hypothetical protein
VINRAAHGSDDDVRSERGLGPHDAAERRGRRDFYDDAKDLFVLDGSRVRPPKESTRRAVDGV